MTLVTVSMAALEVSSDPDAVLVTYALGSCIAVMAHDPQRELAGMIHYMLPSSATNPERALVNPAMFADTGVPALFEALYRLGARKTELVVKVAGGSNVFDHGRTFDIGRKNYAAVRKIFARNGVCITAEDVGGPVSRTARLWVGTGRVSIRTGQGEYEL